MCAYYQCIKAKAALGRLTNFNGHQVWGKEKSDEMKKNTSEKLKGNKNLGRGLTYIIESTRREKIREKIRSVESQFTTLEKERNTLRSKPYVYKSL